MATLQPASVAHRVVGTLPGDDDGDDVRDGAAPARARGGIAAHTHASSSSAASTHGGVWGFVTRGAELRVWTAAHGAFTASWTLHAHGAHESDAPTEIVCVEEMQFAGRMCLAAVVRVRGDESASQVHVLCPATRTIVRVLALPFACTALHALAAPAHDAHHAVVRAFGAVLLAGSADGRVLLVDVGGVEDDPDADDGGVWPCVEVRGGGEGAVATAPRLTGKRGFVQLLAPPVRSVLAGGAAAATGAVTVLCAHGDATLVAIGHESGDVQVASLQTLAGTGERITALQGGAVTALSWLGIGATLCVCRAAPRGASHGSAAVVAVHASSGTHAVVGSWELCDEAAAAAAAGGDDGAETTPLSARTMLVRGDVSLCAIVWCAEDADGRRSYVDVVACASGQLDTATYAVPDTSVLGACVRDGSATDHGALPTVPLAKCLSFDVAALGASADGECQATEVSFVSPTGHAIAMLSNDGAAALHDPARVYAACERAGLLTDYDGAVSSASNDNDAKCRVLMDVALRHHLPAVVAEFITAREAPTSLQTIDAPPYVLRNPKPVLQWAMARVDTLRAHVEHALDALLEPYASEDVVESMEHALEHAFHTLAAIYEVLCVLQSRATTNEGLDALLAKAERVVLLSQQVELALWMIANDVLPQRDEEGCVCAPWKAMAAARDTRAAAAADGAIALGEQLLAAELSDDARALAPCNDLAQWLALFAAGGAADVFAKRQLFLFWLLDVALHCGDGLGHNDTHVDRVAAAYAEGALLPESTVHTVVALHALDATLSHGSSPKVRSTLLQKALTYVRDGATLASSDIDVSVDVAACLLHSEHVDGALAVVRTAPAVVFAEPRAAMVKLGVLLESNALQSALLWAREIAAAGADAQPAYTALFQHCYARGFMDTLLALPLSPEEDARLERTLRAQVPAEEEYGHVHSLDVLLMLHVQRGRLDVAMALWRELRVRAPHAQRDAIMRNVTLLLPETLATSALVTGEPGTDGDGDATMGGGGGGNKKATPAASTGEDDPVLAALHAKLLAPVCSSAAPLEVSPPAAPVGGESTIAVGAPPPATPATPMVSTAVAPVFSSTQQMFDLNTPAPVREARHARAAQTPFTRSHLHASLQAQTATPPPTAAAAAAPSPAAVTPGKANLARLHELARSLQGTVAGKEHGGRAGLPPAQSLAGMRSTPVRAPAATMALHGPPTPQRPQQSVLATPPAQPVYAHRSLLRGRAAPSTPTSGAPASPSPASPFALRSPYAAAAGAATAATYSVPMASPAPMRSFASPAPPSTPGSSSTPRARVRVSSYQLRAHR